MPSNLQGLNIIHPVPPHGDAQDLLSGPPFPDLSAQLDLWTNLTFDSEESPITRAEDGFNNDRVDEEDENDVHPTTTVGETAIRDGHTNVVTGTVVPSNQPSPVNSLGTLHPTSANLSAQQLFDLNAFFTNFGVDPFSAPTFANPHASLTPSLAQLLALHSMQNAYGAPIHHPPPQQAVVQPVAPAQPVSSTLPATSPVARNSAEDADARASKRARTRKSSISSPDGATPPPTESSNTGPASTQTLLAAEDKRRRNTAASARFRLKKKEREAALEGKAKELENRVNELERECEALRRENGWLKGLVVGVTGAAQAPVAAAASTISSPQVAPTGNTTQRGKDEVDAASM